MTGSAPLDVVILGGSGGDKLSKLRFGNYCLRSGSDFDSKKIIFWDRDDLPTLLKKLPKHDAKQRSIRSVLGLRKTQKSI